MSQSSEEKRFSYGIIDRFFSRLKYSKPDQTEQINEAQEANNVESTTLYLEDTKQVEESNNQNSMLKFSVYCDELEKFADLLKDDAKLNRFIYDYPKFLQNRVNQDAEELKNLLNIVRETAADVKKLKSQRKYVKKEISAVKKTIKRLKDNQSRELESLILRLDKDLYNRWMKSRLKIDELHDFMFDVQEKIVALESLKLLIDRHLEKQSSLIEEDSEENASSNSDQLVPLPAPVFSFESPIPPPPPCPMITASRVVPLTVNSLNRNNSRLSWVQRRIRAERRGNFAAITNNYENESINRPYNQSNSVYGNNRDNALLPLEFNLSRFSCNSIDTTSSTSESHDEPTTSKT